MFPYLCNSSYYITEDFFSSNSFQISTAPKQLFKIISFYLYILGFKITVGFPHNRYYILILSSTLILYTAL